jgi:hypothetical protein
MATTIANMEAELGLPLTQAQDCVRETPTLLEAARL